MIKPAIGALTGAAVGQIQGWQATGYEFKINKDLRIAPFGNRTGNPTGELPHYHQRIIGSDGKTISGGSLDWHRPWEGKWK